MTRLLCYLFGHCPYFSVGLSDTCYLCGAKQAATEGTIWVGGKMR